MFDLLLSCYRRSIITRSLNPKWNLLLAQEQSNDGTDVSLAVSCKAIINQRHTASIHCAFLHCITRRRIFVFFFHTKHVVVTQMLAVGRWVATADIINEKILLLLGWKEWKERRKWGVKVVKYDGKTETRKLRKLRSFPLSPEKYVPTRQVSEIYLCTYLEAGLLEG